MLPVHSSRHLGPGQKEVESLGQWATAAQREWKTCQDASEWSTCVRVPLRNARHSVLTQLSICSVTPAGRKDVWAADGPQAPPPPSSTMAVCLIALLSRDHISKGNALDTGRPPLHQAKLTPRCVVATWLEVSNPSWAWGRAEPRGHKPKDVQGDVLWVVRRLCPPHASLPPCGLHEGGRSA